MRDAVSMHERRGRPAPTIGRDVSEIRDGAMQDLAQMQPVAGDTIVGRGVDAWYWVVIYEDGSTGAVVWGERHDRGTPVGMQLPVEASGVARELRIDFAVRVALVAQIRCRDEIGMAVTRYLILPVR